MTNQTQSSVQLKNYPHSQCHDGDSPSQRIGGGFSIGVNKLLVDKPNEPIANFSVGLNGVKYRTTINSSSLRKITPAVPAAGSGNSENIKVVDDKIMSPANLTDSGTTDSADLTVCKHTDPADLTGSGNTDPADLTGSGNTDPADLTGSGNTDPADLTGSGNTDPADLTDSGTTDSAETKVKYPVGKHPNILAALNKHRWSGKGKNIIFEDTGVFLDCLTTIKKEDYPELVEAGFWDRTLVMVHRCMHYEGTYKDREYMRCSHETMYDWVPKNKTKAFRKAIVDSGIFMFDSHFIQSTPSAKGMAQGFCINPALKVHADLCKQQLRERTVAKNYKKMQRKYIEHPQRADEFGFEELSPQKRKNILNLQDSYSDNLRIDKDKALDIAEKKISKVSKDGGLSPYNCALLDIDRIARGDCKFIVCQAGRTHHAWGRCNSLLRSAAYYEGHEQENLCSVDIKNSQLTFGAKAIRDYASEKGFGEILNNIRVSKSKFKYVFNLYSLSLIPFNTPGELETAFSEELTRFDNLAKSGTMYEYFAEKEVLQGQERKDFKERFFKEFYFANNKQKYCAESEITKQFVREFPLMFFIIQMMKRKNFKTFPVLMQKAESEFVLHNVSQILLAQGIPLTTIHDSFVVPENMKDEVIKAVLSQVPDMPLEVTVYN